MRSIPRRIDMARLRRAGVAIGFVAAVATLSGCTTLVVPPETVTVRRAPDGKPETLHYPVRVIVHDDEWFWDAHQIKDNLVGLSELEVVRVVDILADTLTPGPERRPVENSIEWIKNEYARLPRCAPVTIVGGLFWAIGIEKTAAGRGQLFFPRFVYLLDWGGLVLGEINRLGGYALPGRNRFVPERWTAPASRGFDWTLSELIGVYVWVFQTVDRGLDLAIDGGEKAWQKTVWVLATAYYMSAHQ